jgi:ABC-type multidrug transport system fused ATPase/permease subunit
LKDEVPASKLAEFVPDDAVFTFQDVSFISPYYDRLVLKNIHCEIKAGSKLAVISNTQLGSETFIKLLQNHFSPTTGNVLLNNLNIAHYDLNIVKSKIGSFMQCDTIFYGTILDNIQMGRKEIALDRLNEVLNTLGLLDFVNSFPQGLDTYLLSGGNFLATEIAQKIILARALVGSPTIMLADTSWQLLYEIDPKSFNSLLTKDASSSGFVACVTDLALLDLFDEIAVIDNGELIAFGPRKEVLSKVAIEKYCHV